MTHVCPVCRLAQEPAETCRWCGEAVPGDVVTKAETFLVPARRPLGWTQRVSPRLAKVIGLGLGMPLLAILFVIPQLRAYVSTVMVVAMASLILAVIAAMLGRPALIPSGYRALLRPAPLRPLEPHAGAAHWKGIARRLRAQVGRYDSDEECLAASVLVRARGELLLRAGRSADFVLDLGDGETRVVRGEHLVVDTAAEAVWSACTAAPMSLAMAPLKLAGERADTVVNDGDEIEAWGTEESDALPELASYREAGFAKVLRGTPGRPVIVRKR